MTSLILGRLGHTQTALEKSDPKSANTYLCSNNATSVNSLNGADSFFPSTASYGCRFLGHLWLVRVDHSCKLNPGLIHAEKCTLSCVCAAPCTFYWRLEVGRYILVIFFWQRRPSTSFAIKKLPAHIFFFTFIIFCSASHTMNYIYLTG